MFSKSCEYGIRAMLFIVGKSLKGERARLKEIAKQVGAPEAFTAKILQNLARHQIVHSSTGPKGGFFIEKEEIKDINLMQIVKAIDGDRLVNQCGLGLHKCDANHPCPVHYKFKKIRDDLINMLTNMNVNDMAVGVESGETFLKY